MALSYSGLTIEQTIQQSQACHPDWTPTDHAEYLLSEEPFEREEVVAAVAKRFSVDPEVVLPSCVECDNPNPLYRVKGKAYCTTCYGRLP